MACYSNCAAKQLVVVLVAVLGVSCRAPAIWSYEGQLGVVAAKAGKGCLQIHNSAVQPNADIRLVTAMPPQSVADARAGARDTACAEGGDIQGYSVLPGAGQMPVIGVVNYRGEFRKDGDVVSADLDGDGAPEYFRSCLSQEGIHFTVWTGKPLTGKLRWHQYHYLGYDISPDCKPEETGR